MDEKLLIKITADLGGMKKELEIGQEAFQKFMKEAENASKGADGLTDTVIKQTKQLKDLKQKMIDVVAEYGENSKEAYECGVEIGNLSAELKKNKSAMEAAQKVADAWDEAIEDVADAIGGAEGATDTFTNALKKQATELQELKQKYVDIVAEQGDESDAAKQCAKEIEELSQEFKDNKDKAMNAAKAADKLDKSIGDVGNEAQKSTSKMATFNDAMGKVGSAVNKGLAVAGGAIVAAGGALMGLTASTQEYRTEQSKLISAFETAGASAETAKTTYNDLFRVLGDSGQATEAANHLALLTTNQQDLSEWTNICQGVYATFGASLPLEGLTEAINHTTKLGEVQGPLADALEWMGITTDDFNAKLATCNSESEREALIRETLSGVYSDAASAYEKNAADVLAQNEAQAKLNESTARLGEAMAPVLTAFTEMGATIAEQLAPAIEGLVSEHGEQLESFLQTVADTLSVIITFIVDNIGIIGTIAGIILAIAAAINVYNIAMAVYNALMAPVNLVILAIVAAIAALIAIIVLVIKYWDEIVEACVACWDTIMDAIQVAIDWIVGIFNSIIDFVKKNWQGLLLLLVNPFAGAFKLLYDNCDGFREFIDNLVQKIGGFFKDLWDGFKNGAKNAWEGVKSIFSKVSEFFKTIFSNAWEGVKKVFSTGGKIFDGIKDGIVNAFKTVVNAIIRGINKVVKLPFQGLNGILDKLNGLSIAGVKPFSWLTWRATIPEIPELAKGGIVDSATLAVIGERGKEAVMPLENNTEWMNILAAKLSERISGSNTPIVLQVDGRTFAQTAINTINANTRQTGRIGLNII